MTNFLCQGIFSTFQKIKLVLLIGHWLFVIFKTTFTESRRIIKSRIGGFTITSKSSSRVSKCNPEIRLLNKQNRWSRKAVEDLLESCTFSFTCFISMYVLKARIFDLTLRPPPPHPFVYHFWQRRYTFCIPPIEKWYTFTYLAEKFISLLTAENALYIWTNCQTRTAFSRPFHNHKMRQLALLRLFTNRNDKFPYPFIYLNYWNPSPFHIPQWRLKTRLFPVQAIIDPPPRLLHRHLKC